MKCLLCGATAREELIEQTITVGGRKYVYKVPAVTCSKCGESLMNGPDVKALEVRVAARIANDGIVSGETFRFMRNVLGMKAVNLAALLDVTPETISRWENGAKNVDRASWVTLGGLIIDELEGKHAALDRLKKAAGKPPRAKVVRLCA